MRSPAAQGLSGGLALLLFCAAATVAAQSLRVVQVRVEGNAVNTAVAIQQFLPSQREPAVLQVRAGQTLTDGIEIGVPARTVVVLQSVNGNRIELAPDTRFTARVNASGEVHTVQGGSARFDVRNALSFFNVDFNRFVALVRGTEFDVEAGAGGEGAAAVLHGRIAVLREVPTLMQDSGRQLDMLEQQVLDARDNPRQAWPATETLRRYARSDEAVATYNSDLANATQRNDRDGQMAALNNLGLAWLARGDPAEAQKYLRRMLNMAQAGQDDPWRARALNNLGAAALEQGDYKGAVGNLENALAVNRTLEPHAAQRRIAQVEGNLGLAWRHLGDAARARDYTGRSLRAHQQLAAGRDSAAVANNLESLGIIETDSARAVAYQREALQMRERLYGDTPHPALASSFINLGFLAARAGDDRGAAQYYGRAVAVREKLFARQNHPLLAEALVRHGAAQCRGGDIDGGLAQCERALAMRLALSKGPVDAAVVDGYRQLAACWALAAGQGRGGAQEKMAQALERLKAYQSAGTPAAPGTY